MKLLFDQNLSHKLVLQLADIFSDSAHVRQINLRDADDRTVWDYARDHECIIVTKDSDFADLSFLLGPPPVIVWIRIGNCTTDDIAFALRKNFAMIEMIVKNGMGRVIELY